MTKRELLEHIGQYVNVTVGDLRKDFNIKSTTFSAVRWKGNSVYVPLPSDITKLLSELIEDEWLDVTTISGVGAVIKEEYFGDFPPAHQPVGAIVITNGDPISVEDRYMTLKFKRIR